MKSYYSPKVRNQNYKNLSSSLTRGVKTLNQPLRITNDSISMNQENKAGLKKEIREHIESLKNMRKEIVKNQSVLKSCAFDNHTKNVDQECVFETKYFHSTNNEKIIPILRIKDVNIESSNAIKQTKNGSQTRQSKEKENEANDSHRSKAKVKQSQRKEMPVLNDNSFDEKDIMYADLITKIRKENEILKKEIETYIDYEKKKKSNSSGGSKLETNYSHDSMERSPYNQIFASPKDPISPNSQSLCAPVSSFRFCSEKSSARENFPLNHTLKVDSKNSTYIQDEQWKRNDSKTNSKEADNHSGSEVNSELPNSNWYEGFSDSVTPNGNKLVQINSERIKGTTLFDSEPEKSPLTERIHPQEIENAPYHDNEILDNDLKIQVFPKSYFLKLVNSESSKNFGKESSGLKNVSQVTNHNDNFSRPQDSLDDFSDKMEGNYTSSSTKYSDKVVESENLTKSSGKLPAVDFQERSKIVLNQEIFSELNLKVKKLEGELENFRDLNVKYTLLQEESVLKSKRIEELESELESRKKASLNESDIQHEKSQAKKLEQITLEKTFLCEKAEELYKTVDDLNSKNEKLEKMRERNNEMIQSLENKIFGKTQENEYLITQNNFLQEENKKLTLQIDLVKENNRDCKGIISILESKISEKDREITESRKKLEATDKNYYRILEMKNSEKWIKLKKSNLIPEGKKPVKPLCTKKIIKYRFNPKQNLLRDSICFYREIIEKKHGEKDTENKIIENAHLEDDFYKHSNTPLMKAFVYALITFLGNLFIWTVIGQFY